MAMNIVIQLRMGGQVQYSKKHISKKLQADHWTDGPTQQVCD